jgi:N-acetylneuraminate synthase
MSCFIIAEVGINHNGDIDIAKKLIDGAVLAGCDAVKFQKRTVDKIYTKEELDKPRESPWGTTNRQQKYGLEFEKEQYDIIDTHCKERKIAWFASAWDLESQLFLRKYNLRYNKVASANLTNKKLLETIAEEKKYTFISTGMSTMDEISRAVQLFRGHECPFELMHCNSCYPAAPEQANLNCMKTLAKTFNCKTGYSSHHVGIIVSCAAVALGATSLEAHITLDRAMYGSDQAASIEVMGFARMVKYIRTIESALGDGIKAISREEETVKSKLRKVVTM